MPDYERRISLACCSEDTAADIYWKLDDIRYLDEQSITGMDSLVTASFPRNTEITVIDKNQQELPFIIKYQCVSSSFFPYKVIRPVSGKGKLDAPDEVIISQEFAHKAFGKEDPTGMIIHLVPTYKEYPEQIKDYKIVGVVTDQDLDCYFPLSMDPYASFSVGTFLMGETTLENLNKQLKQTTWQRGELNVYAYASLNAARNDDLQRNITMLLFRFVGSLILLSGLINFLKFIIQMFYNRQRELALRKCLGSNIKGLFSLLFAEIFWMLSIAFLLSLIITEVVVSLAYVYIPQEDMISLPMPKIYGMQLGLYMVLLLVCMSVILYPIHRLRQLSIIHYIVQKRERHVFRNIMISVQLAISIFFVGGVFGITLIFNDMFDKMYSPLSSEEEKQIVSLSVNSIRMRQNMDAILSDIDRLPDITDRISLSRSFDIQAFTYMNYIKNGRPQGQVLMATGDPHYFEFFKIPMEGKLVDKNDRGTVYVSEQFKEQLQKDSIEGSVTLSGDEYRIAGTFRALYKEGGQRNLSGSVFLADPYPSAYYFKTSGSDATSNVIKEITEICRRYVPATLPLDIHDFSDSKQTVMGTVNLMRSAFMLLAIVSLLLVILSIYSAISMDTVSRQKEVAIRKINGATPKVIALLFGKTYLIIYVLTFCCVYPILRLTLAELAADTTLGNIYSWDKGMLLFLAIALLIFLVTAYKIYEMMHLNPANIVKKGIKENVHRALSHTNSAKAHDEHTLRHSVQLLLSTKYISGTVIVYYNKEQTLKKPLFMIKHLLTITLRNMTKQKVRSIISILCITAGLLCFSVCHYYSTIMSRGNKFLDTYERMAVIRGKNNPNMYIGFSPDKIKGLGNEEILGMAFFTNGTTNFETQSDAVYRVSTTFCNHDYFLVFPPKLIEGSLKDFDKRPDIIVVTKKLHPKICRCRHYHRFFRHHQ